LVAPFNALAHSIVIKSFVVKERLKKIIGFYLSKNYIKAVLHNLEFKEKTKNSNY
jgi:hypothetical protein